MNDAASPENDTSQADSPAADAKNRNPIERTIVWGLIGVLLIILAIEGNSWFRFTRSLSAVQEAIQAADKSDQQLKMDSVEKLISGSPQVTDEQHGISGVKTYQWSGLIKDRSFHVEYGLRTGVVYQAYPEGVARVEERKTSYVEDEDPDAVLMMPGGGGMSEENEPPSAEESNNAPTDGTNPRDDTDPPQPSKEKEASQEDSPEEPPAKESDN